MLRFSISDFFVWLVLILLDLIAGVAEYISACQTYEGGFGGEPGNEAHGGYTFCSIATLLILQRVRNHHYCLFVCFFYYY